MSYINLFEPIHHEKLETLAQLRTKLANLNYEYEEVSPQGIKLLEDGKIQLRDGNKYPITLPGVLYYITKVLKIPDPFSKRIPYDLLQHNFSKLSEALDDSVTLILKNDKIINAVLGSYTPLPTNGILESFENQEINMIEFSDENINIQTVNNLLDFHVEPKPGHLTKAGIHFITSESGFVDPVANSLLYTLVCSNGAILPRKHGQAKIKIKGKEINPEQIVPAFRYKIDHLLKDSARIIERYNKMPEIQMDNFRANSVLRSLAKILDEDSAIDLFGIDTEERKEIKAKAKIDEMRDQETDFNLYNIHYKVTEIANSFKGSTRRRLQVLGGRMLNYEELN